MAPPPPRRMEGTVAMVVSLTPALSQGGVYYPHWRQSVTGRLGWRDGRC